MKEATVNLFLGKRSLKANGKYPVKLIIYFLEDKKKYGTGIDMGEEEWNKITAPKLKGAALKEPEFRLDTIVQKASKII